MALSRHEQLYYNNIERIANALEALVAQGKQATSDSSIRRLTAASDLLYGNSKSPLKNNPGSGRSEDNYTYPQFVKMHYKKEQGSSSKINDFEPNLQSEQDERIYVESQHITGGEFSKWYNNLNESEKESYQRIYGH